jgi:hypothetical protein
MEKTAQPGLECIEQLLTNLAASAIWKLIEDKGLAAAATALNILWCRPNHSPGSWGACGTDSFNSTIRVERLGENPRELAIRQIRQRVGETKTPP